MNTFWKTFFAALLAVIVGFILHFFLIVIFIAGLIGAASSSSSSVPVVKNNSVLKIDFTVNSLGERTADAMDNLSLESLYFGGSGSTLGIYDAIKAVRAAAKNSKIKMIYIYTDYSTSAGISNIEELRNVLKEFRESGKPIIAYGMNFTTGSYYLASVADKVYMNTEGDAIMTGLGGYMLFYKDLADRIGLDIQLIRHGKFKAAAEQYIASNISPANREQNEALYGSIWNSWAEEICSDRSISKESLDSAINNLALGDAQSMISLGLVDSALTTPALYAKVADYMGVESKKDYNVISLEEYSQTVASHSKASSKIAVLYANGEITMNGTDGIGATSFIKEIQKVRDDDNIKAVVFRVNSPGGDAQAADVIRDELALLKEKKPIVVSFGDYAASGGYWISAEAGPIFSDKTTITGSIGVFALVISYGNALKKHLNINAAKIGTHQHAGMGSGIAPLAPDEVSYMESFIEHIYTKFTNIVAGGRGLTAEYVDSIGQGRVWSGADGLNIKLVDHIGGLTDAIAYAATLIDENSEAADYKIVEYPAIKSQWESILESLSGTTDQQELIMSKLQQLFEQYRGTHTYARLPYVYRLEY